MMPRRGCVCRHHSTQFLLFSLLLLLGPPPPSRQRRGSPDEGRGWGRGERTGSTVVVAAGGLGLALAANLDDQAAVSSDNEVEKDRSNEDDNFFDNVTAVVDTVNIALI